jgi:hypothetical protein
MLEDYPANPMDSLRNDSPDVEDVIPYEYEGERFRLKRLGARTRESR